MKDVIERLTKLSKVGFGYDITFEDREALKDAVEALSASPAGVVKPLEWVGNDDMAYNSLFGYHASNIAGRCVLRGPLISSIQTDTLEAAKDAAFADYSSRIMSAIEPAGVGVETAAYKALKAWEAWEAKLILEGSDQLWCEIGDLSELQALRNAALTKEATDV